MPSVAPVVTRISESGSYDEPVVARQLGRDRLAQRLLAAIVRIPRAARLHRRRRRVDDVRRRVEVRLAAHQRDDRASARLHLADLGQDRVDGGRFEQRGAAREMEWCPEAPVYCKVEKWKKWKKWRVSWSSSLSGCLQRGVAGGAHRFSEICQHSASSVRRLRIASAIRYRASRRTDDRLVVRVMPRPPRSSRCHAVRGVRCVLERVDAVCRTADASIETYSTYFSTFPLFNFSTSANRLYRGLPTRRVRRAEVSAGGRRAALRHEGSSFPRADAETPTHR